MNIATVHCSSCNQFQTAVITLDPPYYVCSVCNEDRFNSIMGYDRGELEDDAYLWRHYTADRPLPKIQKAPR